VRVRFLIACSYGTGTDTGKLCRANDRSRCHHNRKSTTSARPANGWAVVLPRSIRAIEFYV
jgi:hypothetical protein